MLGSLGGPPTGYPTSQGPRNAPKGYRPHRNTRGIGAERNVPRGLIEGISYLRKPVHEGNQEEGTYTEDKREDQEAEDGRKSANA
ncbi:hypothetical protein NDU88_001939 [Pleurodeles waltl]|uniref:Uncharacterized protein n=1 Tax=Pleurodeles waltl TaxID=8319 RepID=A0AAV7TKC1_PLEWA|nr:hypothetical protein NDU88_001939 [Pleurodeles waltl]